MEKKLAKTKNKLDKLKQFEIKFLTLKHQVDYN